MAEERKSRSTGSSSRSAGRGGSGSGAKTGGQGGAKRTAGTKRAPARSGASKPASKPTASKSSPPKSRAKAPAKATAGRKPGAKKAQAKAAPARKRSPQAGQKAPSRPPVNQPASKKAGAEKKPKAESKDERSNGQPRGDLPTAPSLGPNTVIEREPVEERMARHDQSTVDAMGHDKRRAVVGKSYGASFAKQATIYGAFLAVIVALAVGGKLLADKLDEPPATNPDEAPWSASDATQRPPDPLQ